MCFPYRCIILVDEAPCTLCCVCVWLCIHHLFEFLLLPFPISFWTVWIVNFKLIKPPRWLCICKLHRHNLAEYQMFSFCEPALFLFLRKKKPSFPPGVPIKYLIGTFRSGTASPSLIFQMPKETGAPNVHFRASVTLISAICNFASHSWSSWN